MSEENKFYDIVIIGASIGGLNAAEFLLGSKMKILVIEREKELGKKPCAHGITPQDLKFIPNNLVNFPLSNFTIERNGKKILFPKKTSLISSVNRKKYLENKFLILQKSENTDFK